MNTLISDTCLCLLSTHTPCNAIQMNMFSPGPSPQKSMMKEHPIYACYYPSGHSLLPFLHQSLEMKYWHHIHPALEMPSMAGCSLSRIILLQQDTAAWQGSQWTMGRPGIFCPLLRIFFTCPYISFLLMVIGPLFPEDHF